MTWSQIAPHAGWSPVGGSGKGSVPARSGGWAKEQSKQGTLKARLELCFAVLRLNVSRSWTSVLKAWNQTIPTKPGAFGILSVSSSVTLAVCRSSLACYPGKSFCRSSLGTLKKDWICNIRPDFLDLSPQKSTAVEWWHLMVGTQCKTRIQQGCKWAERTVSLFMDTK